MCDTVLDKIKLSDNVVSDMRKISLKEGAASELEGNYVHGVSHMFKNVGKMIFVV